MVLQVFLCLQGFVWAKKKKTSSTLSVPLGTMVEYTTQQWPVILRHLYHCMEALLTFSGLVGFQYTVTFAVLSFYPCRLVKEKWHNLYCKYKTDCTRVNIVTFIHSSHGNHCHCCFCHYFFFSHHTLLIAFLSFTKHSETMVLEKLTFKPCLPLLWWHQFYNVCDLY